jgi:5-methylcytosine-specific restriction endonuclease McrA
MNLAALRETVWQRCGGYCEMCGVPVRRDQFALHHRKLKSRGGKNEVTNLVALHHYCHNLGTDSVHLNPEVATRAGFLVASWCDPADIPVILGDGGEAFLLPDGTYRMTGEGNGW